MNRVVAPIVAAALLVSGAGVAFAQGSDHNHVGVGVKAGTEGFGADVAVPVAPRINVRVGASAYSIDHDFDDSGITIAATLKLSGVDAHVDLFPFGGGFHISPGLLIHNGTKLTGNVSVPAGKQFDLGDETLISKAGDPVAGKANVSFKTTAPTLLIGWGNLVPRGERRWSLQFDMGVAFSKQPTFGMTLSGSACQVNNPAVCNPIATNAQLQADLQKQIKDANKDLEPLKILPVISFGFGYKF